MKFSEMKLYNLLIFCVQLSSIVFLFSQRVQCYHVPLLAVGNMEDVMMEEKFIPDIIDKIPIYIAEVSYNNVTLATFGNIIPKSIYKKAPESVKWIPDCHLFYTIIFTDVDANPKWPRRERQLWIIGNIPGESYESGENITEYGIPEPKRGSGKHKILTLIYEQPNKVEFKEPIITDVDDERRDNFSTIAFVKKYNLEFPNAANFFSIEFEEEENSEDQYPIAS